MSVDVDLKWDDKEDSNYLHLLASNNPVDEDDEYYLFAKVGDTSINLDGIPTSFLITIISEALDELDMSPEGLVVEIARRRRQSVDDILHRRQ